MWVKIDFKAYLDNMIQEANLLTTTIGKHIPSNLMKDTEQPAQVSFTTEIGGCINSW